MNATLAAPSVVRPPAVAAPAKRPQFMLVATAVLAGIACYCFLGHNKENPHAELFPPFKKGLVVHSANTLGTEYYNIGNALIHDRGYADPFVDPTGPTAWMPPLLPILMAGLILATGNSIPFMMVVLMAIQVASLAFCLAAVRRMLPGRPAWLVTTVFALLVVMQFRLAFQGAHDYGVLMLMLSGLILWDFDRDPLASRRSAALWGAFGGAIVLTSPVIGLVWCGLTVRRGVRPDRRVHMVLAGAVVAAFLAPWVARNYVVFGRVIPVKSNLFYELYQSQVETPDGVIENVLFDTHPANEPGPIRDEYIARGEMAFLDARKEAFLAAYHADPADFARRVRNRFAVAMYDYRPFDQRLEPNFPGAAEYCRVVHRLPALAILVLLVGSPWRRLTRVQWGVIAAYVVCLTPYIVASYYDRYAYPLLALKVLLVVWAAESLAACVRKLADRGRQPAVQSA